MRAGTAAGAGLKHEKERSRRGSRYEAKLRGIFGGGAPGERTIKSESETGRQTLRMLLGAPDCRAMLDVGMVGE